MKLLNIFLNLFRMPDEIATMDFNDTFLDIDHLRSCFPGYEIEVTTDETEKIVRPFKLTFEDVYCKQNNEELCKTITVEPHVPPSRGPYIENEPKK